MAIGTTKVVQVTNIAPQATKDQMQTLFGYLGKIEDIRLYPTIRDVSCPVQSRICYIKFIDSSTVGIAQHMTNTVFIDRALIVIPVQNGDIPDEYYALEMTRNGSIVPGLCPSEPKLPPNVVNSVSGTGGEQVINTTDPQLEKNGLPQYPPLPGNLDSCKVEEIRRTILVVNPDPSITPEDLVTFFTQAGEVKYLMACTRQSDNSNHMLIEFSDQPSVIEAFKLQNKELKGKPIKIMHATQAIIKPQAKSNEAAQKEIEEAMSRVKEAQSLISAAIDPVIGMLSKDKRSSRRSRSRSRGRRRRSRSRSRSRRRSRSRHRSKRRSASRSRRSRSRDRRRRSKSRSRRRSRSRSRSRRSKSKRSRSKSRSRHEKDRHRSKTSREKSRGRSSRDKDRERLATFNILTELFTNRNFVFRSKETGRRSRDRKSKEKDRDRSKEKEKPEIKESKTEKESNADQDDKLEKRHSPSRNRYRSRSRSKERKVREKRRSRSRGSKRRSPSPRTSRKRTRSRSRDRKRDKKDKRSDRKERSRSRSKVDRNYDEEEKGFDSEKEKHNTQEVENINEKESEKSDNMDISNSP